MSSFSRAGADLQAAEWAALERELNQWWALDMCASFWWRDDDVCDDSPALRTLLQLTARGQVPLALAAIPARINGRLPQVLCRYDHVSLLQHGFAHVSHAYAGEKKAEFGAHRPMRPMLHDLRRGQQRLRGAFGAQFVPVLVPPWNRYDANLRTRLREAGLLGISAMWARGPCAVEHLPRQVNAHIDPVAWRGDRGFAGMAEVMEQLLSHLRLRREYPAFRDEPTGLLTHHLDHCPEVWSFCEQVIRRIAAHPAARWTSARSIWPS